MSKRFRAQDYFRYRRLGKRWRRPVGWQSKQRLGKGGSGIAPAMGYRTPSATRGKVQGVNVVLVHNVNELSNALVDGAALIASSVGAKKTSAIEKKAKELNIRILNMKKIRRARKISKSIEKRQEERKKLKAKKEEKKEIKKDETAEMKSNDIIKKEN